MGIAIRIGGLAVGSSGGQSWTSRYVILRSDPIRYRREINHAGGYFKLDYSEDSGATWENLETLDLTEPAVVIDLAHIYHHRIVDYEYRVDNFLTPLGYAGIEGVDWENLYTVEYLTPQSPIGLILTVVSDTEIKLDWTNVDTEGTGTRVYFSTDDINFTLKSTNILGVATVNITGLTTGTKYYFYVVAYKGSKESNPSNEVEILMGLNTGLVGYWNFEEASGNAINSVNPGTNDGVPSNVTQNVTGKIGKGYNFSQASNSYVYPGAIDLHTTFTLWAWAKRDTQTPQSGVLFGFGGAGAYAGLWCGEDGTIRTVNTLGGSIPKDWGLVWIDKTQYHLVMIVASVIGVSGSIELYFDGVSKGKAAGVLVEPIVTLSIGKLQASGVFATAYGFDGIIDEVGCSSKAFSLIEAVEIFNLGAGKTQNFSVPYTFNKAKLLLTFDDGSISQFTTAYPLFISKGVKATFYLVSDTVSSVGGIGWANVLTMSRGGMDMQSHSKDHANYTTLTQNQIIAEEAAVDAAFLVNGLPKPNHLAYPGGASNANVTTWIAAIRQTCRIVYPQSVWNHVDRLNIPGYAIDQIDAPVFVVLKAIMDDCVLKKKALTLYTHAIDDSDTVYTIRVANLGLIIDYAKSIGMDIITISELSDLLLTPISQ